MEGPIDALKDALKEVHKRGTHTGVSEKIWCQVKKRILFSRAETEEPAPKTIKHTREATDGKLWRAEMRVIRN